MTETNKYHILVLVLALLISFPIYYYLFFKVMKAINATELMWFLFWIYIPVNVLILIFSKVADMK